MAVNLHADRVEVWKFRSTGVVALCEEVAAFAQAGELQKRGLNPDRAYYAEDQDTIKVVFPNG